MPFPENLIGTSNAVYRAIRILIELRNVTGIRMIVNRMFSSIIDPVGKYSRSFGPATESRCNLPSRRCASVGEREDAEAIKLWNLIFSGELAMNHDGPMITEFPLAAYFSNYPNQLVDGSIAIRMHEHLPLVVVGSGISSRASFSWKAGYPE